MIHLPQPTFPPRLLPCPFCGGGAVIVGPGPDWAVNCQRCTAWGATRKDRDEAVALWNSRVIT